MHRDSVMIKKITNLSSDELLWQTSPIIKLIIDTNTSEVYFIPVSVPTEHIVAMAEILKPKGIVKNFKDIEKNPMLAAHLVPVTFEVVKGLINRMNVGASSAGRYYHVHNSRVNLNKARDVARVLLENGFLEWKEPVVDIEEYESAV